MCNPRNGCKVKNKYYYENVKFDYWNCENLFYTCISGKMQKRIRREGNSDYGGLNAHIRSDREGYEDVMSTHGWGNREGSRLLDFCKKKWAENW